MRIPASCMAVALLSASINLAESAEAYIAQPRQVRGLIGAAQAITTNAISNASLAVPVKLEMSTVDARLVSPISNISHVAQTGMNNSAIIAQTGGPNYSSVLQNGAGNQAVVTQRATSR